MEETALYCKNCHRRYPVQQGIPMLFAPNDWGEEKKDVTEMVKAFYEKTPFPNYDDIDSRHRLEMKAKRNLFAKLLDEQLPRGIRILEAGCGTGQLTNFLGMSWGRSVFGSDLCLNSLRLAQTFRDRYSVNNAAFLQMNLFRPAFRNAVFDLVISNGVLHHTSDPYRGFENIVRLLKPHGYIVVGLYNYLARLPTSWLRFLINVCSDNFRYLDPRLRDTRNELRKTAWYMDQYNHPHESKHSMDQVLTWFDKHDIDFVLSIPKIRGQALTTDECLFEPHNKGHYFERVCVQLEMLLSGGKDGGLFMMIGRKRGSSEKTVADA